MRDHSPQAVAHYGAMRPRTRPLAGALSFQPFQWEGSTSRYRRQKGYDLAQIVQTAPHPYPWTSELYCPCVLTRGTS